MAGRLMSDAEIRRRKKAQGHITQTTSTLGLAGLGVTGAAALAARKPGVLKQVQKLPKMKNATPEKMKDTAINTGIVSGGIGGVGGYNFAAYTNAESRKRKPVVKSMGMDMGYYGEEGRPIKLPEIKVPIEKAWQPVASNFDSEESRRKRAKKYEGAALVGAGGAGAYGAHHGLKAVEAARGVKTKTVKASAGGKVVSGAKEFKALPAGALKATGKHGGKALLGAGAVGLAAGAHGAIKQKRKGSWQPYAKRDTTSAWGIDHMSGQHRETEN
jgi:hypothetical protein